MEPFGLFQFLQNLLTLQPSSQSEQTDTSPSAETETPPTKTPTDTQKKEELPSQNAAVRFLEEHERKAGRRK